MNSSQLKPLAVTFFISGIWYTIAAILYFFLIGNGRLINTPPMDSFFSIFLGSFFLCFAYLQFMSSFSIERHALNVGCLIIGRTFYIVLLYCFMLFESGFPSTFWFTGIIDGGFTLLYFVFAIRGGLELRQLFLPNVNNSNGHKQYQEL